MEYKLLLWILISLVIILIIINLKLRLKYEIDFFGREKFLHENSEKEEFQFTWPDNKKMALSITFDDGRKTQIDNGIPILNKYGVKATFYVSAGSLRLRLNEWKLAMKKGHDIGNHTLNHPCSINHDFSHINSLENYTMTRMFNDLNNENDILKQLFGLYPKSFAYPCGLSFIGKGVDTKSYVPLISQMFESGRLTTGGAAHPVFCDFAKLPAANLDNVSFEKILLLLEEAKITGKWLILYGHDVGENPNTQTTSMITLEAICKYASDPLNKIWIDNVHNIASYIKEKRSEKPFKHISDYKHSTSSVYSKLYAVFYIWKMKLKDIKNYIEKKCKKNS